MSHPRHILACLVAVAATYVPSATHAYYVEVRGTDTEVPIRYADVDDPPAGTVDVTYRVNATTFPAGVTGIDVAIESAFASWTNADCSLVAFNEGAPSDSTDRAHWMSDAGEIYILVYFSDSNEEWTGGPAVGHFYFAHDGTGTLIGGTVVLNSRDHMWATDEAPDSLDVQSIVTAQIGRSLGITSAMEMNATYPRYSAGDITKRTLGADDIAAIQFLYPDDDMTCGVPMAAEDECDGFPPGPGEDPCPPRPMTMPGDGGTIMPGSDAGMAMVDSGTMAGTDGGGSSADAGPGGGGGDGCSCRVGATAESSSSGRVAWLLTLVLVSAFVMRRRR